MDFVLFIIGLVAIVKGADWITDGAANIAHHFGVPTIVVGMTIVAFGSSAPEFVVSVVSAIKGNADMALGNVVGSNIFNILAIIGITALVMPIKVDRANIRNDVPFAVLSSVVIAITAFDSLFGNSEMDCISRTDGLLMLCMFLIFMSYTLSIAKASPLPSPKEGGRSTSSDSHPQQKLLRNCNLVVCGLVALVLGGDWLVDGASGIARMMGLSDSIIALTIVSAGTSAPELAASVMAAKKGDTALALGNVVGSVVFNVFFVLGAAAAICPLTCAEPGRSIGGITSFDILTLLGASAILWLFCRFGKAYYTVTRIEGAIMVIMAIAYYTILVIKA